MEQPGSEQPTNEQPVHADEAARAAAWEADRRLEETSLPGADRSTYTGEAQRQAALDAAEQHNIAAAARELNMTSAEWRARRAELGRPPTPDDMKSSV